VGKSSLINRLLGSKDLARTSSTPGRTRSVNFYRINDWFRFIDLPGYGYAKVSKSEQRTWGPMVEGFLERRRESIAIALLVIDARHGSRELDLTMRDWLEHREIPYVVAATKTDKLSGNGRARAAERLRRDFEGVPIPPVLVSARTGLGIPEIWRHLDRALAAARDRERGRSWTSKN
jgi:GTP-binding protein